MASWTGVITNAGVRLIANWTSETTLNINKAVAGEGCAPIVSLLAQTSLAKERQEISIVSIKCKNDATKIKIQIQSGEKGYLMNQIGLFASIDGGEQVLLALFQNEHGIYIPSSSESPDFLYTFYCVIPVSNQGDISFTCDPSVFVSQKAMEGYVEEKITEHVSDKNNPHKVTAEQIKRANGENVEKALSDYASEVNKVQKAADDAKKAASNATATANEAKMFVEKAISDINSVLDEINGEVV